MFKRFSKTDIAKYAINKIVALNVAGVVQNQVTDRTDFDEDNIPVYVGSLVVGYVVAEQTDKITDPIVDKIAAKLVARKTAKFNGLSAVA